MHRYTARPAIRAGKGWRGRRELAPRCSATRIRCNCWYVWTNTHIKLHVRTTTTTTHHHHHQQAFDSNTRFLVCVTVMFRNPADGFCADRAFGSSGSAKRRRERRLRAMLRHAVAASLVEAHHHSAPKVGAVPYNAPRSQKTARFCHPIRCIVGMTLDRHGVLRII